MDSEIQGRDVFDARLNDEELVVANACDVSTKHKINSINGYDTFTAGISWPRGIEPDAVTERVARLLRSDFNVDLTPHNIEIIDFTTSDAEIL